MYTKPTGEYEPVLGRKPKKETNCTHEQLNLVKGQLGRVYGA